MTKALFCKWCGASLAVCLTVSSLVACGGSSDGGNAIAGAAAVEGTAEGAVTSEGTSEKAAASGAENGTLVGARKKVLTADSMFTDRDLSGESREAESVKIVLEGDLISDPGRGVSVSGNVVTVTEEGVYLLSGTLDEGMIVVDAGDQAKVQLTLGGVTVANSENAAIYVRSADKVFVTLAENSENHLKNGGGYTSLNGDNIDGVIFAKSDLTVNGSGSLSITAQAGHGIVSKDDLKIAGGQISVTAEGHGLSGKDSVRVAGGSLTVTAGKDGIHADNSDDSEKGFVYLAGGELAVTAAGDGVSASGALQMDGGSLRVKAGGGSGGTLSKDENGDTVSAKGVKAGGDMAVNQGSLDIDALDDGLHSDGSLAVNGGTLLIASGDDALHADKTAAVAGGNIRITSSYEGIEGRDVVISGGDITLTASDDGVNATGDKARGGFGGGDCSLLICGGTVRVDAGGDGLDSNGSLAVTGGALFVDGPENGANGALDYETYGEISGGTVVALGASGMAMNFGETSTQGSILLNTGNCPAGTKVSLKDAEGNLLVTYTSQKSFGCAVISCPELVLGGTYVVSAADSDTEIELESLIYGDGFGGFGGDRGGMGGHGGGRRPGGEAPDRSGVPERPGGEIPGGSGLPELPGGEAPGGSGLPEPPGGEVPDGSGLPEPPGGEMPDGSGMPERPEGQVPPQKRGPEEN